MPLSPPPRRALGVPQTFVLLSRDEPVGTASFLAADAPERPDLSPWLASVFVRPDARGRGFALRLIGDVEAAARAAGVETLWLYTHSAERLYAGLGWRRIGMFDRGGREATLMRRDLQ